MATQSIRDLSILQWNCRSFKARALDFASLLDNLAYNPHFLCLSETWLADSDTCSLPDYQSVASSRVGRGGGVVICVRKDVEASLLRLPEIDTLCAAHNIDSCIVRTRVNNTIIHIVSLYHPPNPTLTQTSNFWSVLLNLFDRLGTVVVCGYFNAKHPSWCNASTHHNPAGFLLCQALELSNFVILNDGISTWSSKDGSIRSTIDLTLVTHALASRLEWLVMGDPFGSDHFPLLTTFLDLTPARNECRPHYNVSNVDWNIFSSDLQATVPLLSRNLLTEDFVPSQAAAVYADLLSTITRSLGKAGADIRIHRTASRRPPTYWWNNECTEIARERIRAYKIFKDCPSLENINAYYAASRKARSALRKILSESFRDFCGSLNVHSDTTRTWQILKSFKTTKSLSAANFALSTTRVDTAAATFDRVVTREPPPLLTADFLLGISSKASSLPSPEDPLDEGQDLTFLSAPITRDEFDTHLRALCKKKTALGPDLLTWNIISHLPSGI